MKKLFLLFNTFCCLIAVAGFPASPAPVPSTQYSWLILAPVAGAATVNELANAALLALQTTDPEQLTTYMPTENELTILKRQSSEDMKAILEGQTAADVQSSFQTDFKNLIQEGVSRTLNWSEMQVTEAKLGQPAAKNRMLYPVQLVLQTKTNQTQIILFESIKIKDRYFFFRGIRFKS